MLPSDQAGQEAIAKETQGGGGNVVELPEITVTPEPEPEPEKTGETVSAAAPEGQAAEAGARPAPDDSAGAYHAIDTKNMETETTTRSIRRIWRRSPRRRPLRRSRSRPPTRQPRLRLRGKAVLLQGARKHWGEKPKAPPRPRAKMPTRRSIRIIWRWGHPSARKNVRTCRCRLWHIGLHPKAERFRSPPTKSGGGLHLRSCLRRSCRIGLRSGVAAAACRKLYPKLCSWAYPSRTPAPPILCTCGPATGRIWNVSFSLTRPIGRKPAATTCSYRDGTRARNGPARSYRRPPSPGCGGSGMGMRHMKRGSQCPLLRRCCAKNLVSRSKMRASIAMSSVISVE